MNPETEDDVRRREADRLLAAAIYLHAARGGVESIGRHDLRVAASSPASEETGEVPKRLVH
jgi:hypothetical protein